MEKKDKIIYVLIAIVLLVLALFINFTLIPEYNYHFYQKGFEDGAQQVVDWFINQALVCQQIQIQINDTRINLINPDCEIE